METQSKSLPPEADQPKKFYEVDGFIINCVLKEKKHEFILKILRPCLTCENLLMYLPY